VKLRREENSNHGERVGDGKGKTQNTHKKKNYYNK
jgi:hypothetical protein